MAEAIRNTDLFAGLITLPHRTRWVSTRPEGSRYRFEWSWWPFKQLHTMFSAKTLVQVLTKTPISSSSRCGEMNRIGTYNCSVFLNVTWAKSTGGCSKIANPIFWFVWLFIILSLISTSKMLERLQFTWI